jgi:hypothetical protein
MDEILPCAKCGGTAALEAFTLNTFTRWRVRCGRCQAVGIHYHRTPVAIGLWNEANAVLTDLAAANLRAAASGRAGPCPRKADGELLQKLLAILADHVGPGADNRGEGAVETLTRIIKQRDDLLTRLKT